MPTYSGLFPLVAQGQAVTVKHDGVTLSDPAPGSVGSTVRHGSLVYTYEYEAGDDDTTLVATVQTSAGLLTAYLELDTTETAASGGGGGDLSDNTAYLIGTASGATDGATIHVPLEVDDRYGTPPSWLTINGSGDVDLDLDAGGIFFTGLHVLSLDFSDTTPADGPLGGGLTAKINGYQVTTGNFTDTGNGQDSQEIQTLAVDQTGLGVLSFYVESSAADSESAPITDGVAAHEVYVVLKKVIEVSEPIA